MSEVRCLKNLVRTKSEVSIFCTLLNTKTIRLKFVLHVVLAYLMFGMIFQAMSIKLPKAGSTIPEEPEFFKIDPIHQMPGLNT